VAGELRQRDAAFLILSKILPKNLPVLNPALSRAYSIHTNHG